MTDEDDIRDLLAVWAQHYADQAWSDWSALFTADGTYTTTAGQTFSGREAIRQFRTGEQSQVTYVCAPAVIRIQGDVAMAASDYVAYARSTADSSWAIQAVGRLVHELTRRSGGWQFASVREWAYFSGPDTPTPLPSVVRNRS